MGSFFRTALNAFSAWGWGVLFPCVIFSTLSAEEARPISANPQLDAKVYKIASELRCLVCQNETLADSQADLAVDLRKEIRVMVAAGKNDTQVVDFMVARYGQFVRYRPSFNVTTFALWMGPFLLLAGALVWFYFFLRRQKSRLSQEPPSAIEEDDL